MRAERNRLGARRAERQHPRVRPAGAFDRDDQVEASLHQEPGWGSVELTGRGAQRRLLVSLPPWWLARVWACGLALIGRHLVVAVEGAGWPDARVLALRAPGAEPVSLSAHGSDGPPGSPDTPHWEI